MYNFRTVSFVVFTGMFWAVEMGAAAAVWIYLAYTASDESPPPKEEGADVKSEGDDPGVAVKDEPDDPDSGTEADVEDAEGPVATTVRPHARLGVAAGVGSSTESAASAARRRPSAKQEGEG
jgi:hypothetical protein